MENERTIAETPTDLLLRLKDQNINLMLNENDNIEIISVKNKISAETIVEIKNQKEAIVSYLRSLAKNASVRIPNVAEAASYDVSSAQKSLWVVSQIEASSVAYNMTTIKTLTGIQSLPFLKKAIESVIDRHEILRTVFRQDTQGEVKQVILSRKESGFVVDYKDLRNSDIAATEIEQLVARDAIMPFDLEHGPMIRICLLQTADENFTLYYSMHHIITDEWSMHILEDEIIQLYDAYKLGVTPDLPELRIQYKDYAAWEIAQIDGER